MHSPPPADQQPPWHALSVAEVTARLGVDVQHGLTAAQAASRLAHSGRNALPPAERVPAWRRLLRQFHNPLIYVLLVAAAGTLALQDVVDTVVIVLVVGVNAAIGFIQEGKAQKALDAVQALLVPRAMVRRDGRQQMIDAAELVPGDLVLLEPGARVAADLRLLQAKELRIDEAALTGESVAADKTVEPVPADAPLGERACMAYAATVVRSGQALGVVVATGTRSEIGRIGALVAQVRSLDTPLTRRLDRFGRQITVFIVAVALAVLVYGLLLRELPFLEVFLAVVGLAVAAIPEGLPAIVTIVLAIGTQAMARNRAIVRRLPAVESLGSVTVICSDKTGTLTRNQMTAVHVALPAEDLQVGGSGDAVHGSFRRGSDDIDPATHAGLLALARCASWCNDARLEPDPTGTWQVIGDPTEGALLILAAKAGLDVEAAAPRLDTIAFSSERAFMATLHRVADGTVCLLLKGAPERVFDLCARDGSGAPFDRGAWEARVEAAASAGQRVLALAQSAMPADTRSIAIAEMAPQLTLLGLVGLIDPPREEAVAAVAECRQAGIRVKMITGDHLGTAAAIGRQLGLNVEHALSGEAISALDDAALRRRVAATDVFARASPQHKLRLVVALQAEAELVAMTGDGVNDAPALKAADIGVAMGHKGTDAARESADLVLTDDNFATIARAVREGRVVFDNIKKALVFILPTNGGEAGVILLALLTGQALPITAGQILWVNMITAVTLALALAFERAEPGVMRRPPRDPSEPLLTGWLLARIVFVSLLMLGATLAVFDWELRHGASLDTARTAAANMLVLSELFYLFNVRHFTASSLRCEALVGNRVALAMAAAVLLAQLLFTYAPWLQQLFRTTALDAAAWGRIVALAGGVFLAVEAEKALLRRLGVRRL
ncbi:MAG: cation-translocating P-type ATPase [Thiomonas sp.]|jgi:magnesium-transporting ATPase (P-type)